MSGPKHFDMVTAGISKQENNMIAPLSLKIENTDIERETVLNCLWLTISDNLLWKNPVQKLSINVIGILNQLKHVLPSNVSIMLYNSLSLPQLNYYILAWGSLHQTNNSIQNGKMDAKNSVAKELG